MLWIFHNLAARRGERNEDEHWKGNREEGETARGWKTRTARGEFWPDAWRVRGCRRTCRSRRRTRRRSVEPWPVTNGENVCQRERGGGTGGGQGRWEERRRRSKEGVRKGRVGRVHDLTAREAGGFPRGGGGRKRGGEIRGDKERLWWGCCVLNAGTWRLSEGELWKHITARRRRRQTSRDTHCGRVNRRARSLSAFKLLFCNWSLLGICWWSFDVQMELLGMKAVWEKSDAQVSDFISLSLSLSLSLSVSLCLSLSPRCSFSLCFCQLIPHWLLWAQPEEAPNHK